LLLEPSCDVAAGEIVDVSLPALGPFHWETEDGRDTGRDTVTLPAEVGRVYLVQPLRLRGGGCACRLPPAGATDHGAAAAAALLATAVLASLRRRRR
jgi:uncharacterized protein (TIGR03382 family)